jgi:hypothetical protein
MGTSGPENFPLYHRQKSLNLCHFIVVSLVAESNGRLCCHTIYINLLVVIQAFQLVEHILCVDMGDAQSTVMEKVASFRQERVNYFKSVIAYRLLVQVLHHQHKSKASVAQCCTIPY